MPNDARYTQSHRPLAVSFSQVDPDVLLLERFHGNEGLSRLFHFTLDLLAEHDKEIAFEKVLGKELSVRVTDSSGQPRYFHGICSEFRQGPPVAGPKGPATFIRYHAEMEPKFWLWTRNVQSRIFQHKTVVEILKIVLEGLEPVTHLQGDFPTRTYCAQYRESDFAFASRIMEEEGIAYHFTHEEKKHQLVLTNDNAAFATLPPLDWRAEGATSRTAISIHSWEKAQGICVQKFRLRDHYFELPHSDIDERVSLLESVQVGPVKHTLKVVGDANLELYDFPAGYGHTFDEIDRDGTSNPAEMQKVFPNAARRTKLRMEQEASQSVRIAAACNWAACQPGCKLPVTRLNEPFGTYLLTGVSHQADVGSSYRTGEETPFIYANTFQCLPEHLEYRPASVTPRPRMQGTQTATVVGTEEGGIHTEKYGRVKVQFHWDRHGKKDPDSSCWIRVVQPWAGQSWGSINLPRAGQEVVVDFLEGDPDRPIILGSVYNASQMPPYPLPEQAAVSGIKSRSHLSQNPEHFNELRLDDRPGAEAFVIAAQRDFHSVVENDYSLNVDHNSNIKVANDQSLLVGDNPATMNYVMTWNNIEINQLTKSVVSVVSHADVSALNLNTYVVQFTGVANLNTEVSTVKIEKVLTQKYETCGTKSFKTLFSKNEKIGEDHIVSVENDKVESVGRKHRHKVKDTYAVSADKIFVGTASTDEVCDQAWVEAGQVELRGDRGIYAGVKPGGGAVKAALSLAGDGRVFLSGDTITLEAGTEIILRAPKVTVYGSSDQLPYAPAEDAKADMGTQDWSAMFPSDDEIDAGLVQTDSDVEDIK